jgi:cytochrome c556
MKFRSILAASAVIVATGFGTVAIAQDLPFPVQARQGQFKMLGLNMGVLVGMARGERSTMPNARRPRQTTSCAISQIDQSFHWPEGTDNMSLVGTRALPEIWDNLPDVREVVARSAPLPKVWPLWPPTVRTRWPPRSAPLGAACNACHDSYQASE